MDNELKLLSPAGAEPVLYYWPLCKTKQYNGAAEIMDTIKWVGEDYPELKMVLEKYVLTSVDLNDYNSMKTLCDKYNKAVTTYRQLWKGATKPNSKVSERASAALLRHIIQQCYNRSVVDPDKLNQYEPFSPEVYGETSFDLITRMLEEVKLTDDDVFVDLGSGVGQIVIQVAASSKCSKCIGIEKADVPTEFAVSVEKEFRKWMKWYGKKYQDFELIKGDFFDAALRDLIMSSNLVFVNNFAFGPAVDHKLKLIFADMKDGTKIVSSKAFCPLNFRITDRHMSEIGSIMNVSELSSMPGSVSWTGKPVTYFLHTIDRSKLESYFVQVKNNGGNGNGSGHHISRLEDLRSFTRTSSTSAESLSGLKSPEDDTCSLNVPGLTGRRHQVKRSMSNEEDETVVYGPTTRRQWSSWVAQQEKMKRKTVGDKSTKSQHAKSGISPSRSTVKSASTTKTRSSSSLDSGGDADVADDSAASEGSPSGVVFLSPPPPSLASLTLATEASTFAAPSTSLSGATTRHRKRPGRPRKPAAALLRARRRRRLNSSAADVSAATMATPATRGRQQRLWRAATAIASSDGESATPSRHKAALTPTSSSHHGGKTPTAKKKKSREWLDTLDLLHKQIVDNVQVSTEGSVPIKSQQASNSGAILMAEQISPAIPTVDRAEDALTIFLQKTRLEYELFMTHMKSAEFRTEILASITNEQKRQKQLQRRKDHLERQIQQLQEEGCQLLNSRLAQLDMKSATPADLLNKAKEIVIQHQELQAKAAALESEVKSLEMQNQQLQMLTKATDESGVKAGLQHLLIAENQTQEDAKKAILMEISCMFTHRKAYLNEISRMENEIGLLESLVQINSANAGLSECSLIKSSFTSPIVNVSPVLATRAPSVGGVSSCPPSSALGVKANVGDVKKLVGVHSELSRRSVVSRGPSRRQRGGGSFGAGGRRGGSVATGVRRRQAGVVGGGSAVVVGAGSAVVGSKSLDAQRRDDIDEQVEEMVRKIKNMNNASSSISSTPDREKKGVATLDKKSRVTHSVGGMAKTAYERRRDKKRSALVEPVGDPVDKVPESGATVAVLCSSTIDQTVDAVSHGFSSHVAEIPSTMTSKKSQHEKIDVDDEVPLDAPLSDRLRQESFSSVTDSAPSDHDETSANATATPLQALTAAIAHVVGHSTTASASPEMFDAHPKTELVGSSKISLCYEKSVTSSQALIAENIRPSSVPLKHPSPVFSSKIEQRRGMLDVTSGHAQLRPFSIGALLVDEKTRTTWKSVEQQEPQRRASSADGHVAIDCRPVTTRMSTQTKASGTTSSQRLTATVDSGYGDDDVESSSASTKLTQSKNALAPHEPQKEAIASPNLFKNTSNTGQPGNPHEYSNPGNPTDRRSTSSQQHNTKQPQQRPAAGQSKPRRFAAAPPPTTTSPASFRRRAAPNLDDASPQDVIESKSLLNPFRIPRRSTSGNAADVRRRVTAGCGGVLLDDQPSDSRSPLASWAPMPSTAQRQNGSNLNRKRLVQTTESYPKRRPRCNEISSPNQSSPFNVFPLDGILNKMALPVKNKHRDRDESKSRHSSATSNSGQNFKKIFTRENSIGSKIVYNSSTLTRESLLQHVTLVEHHHFSHQGLMEALLEHKMSTGRIESHAVLAPKLTDYFSTAKATLGGDMRRQRRVVTQSPGAGVDGKRNARVDLGSTIAASGPQTPPGLTQRGPQTPPPYAKDDGAFLNSGAAIVDGNATPSSSNDSVARTFDGSLLPVSDLTAGGEKETTGEVDGGEGPSSLEGVAATAAELLLCDASNQLGAESLRTLRALDPAVLVATLSTLLGSIVRNAAADGTVDKAKIRRRRRIVEQLTSTTPSKISECQRIVEQHQEPQVTSTCDAEKPTKLKASSTRKHSQDEMDLESSTSNDDDSPPDNTGRSSTNHALLPSSVMPAPPAPPSVPPTRTPLLPAAPQPPNLMAPPLPPGSAPPFPPSVDPLSPASPAFNFVTALSAPPNLFNNQIPQTVTPPQPNFTQIRSTIGLSAAAALIAPPPPILAPPPVLLTMPPPPLPFSGLAPMSVASQSPAIRSTLLTAGASHISGVVSTGATDAAVRFLRALTFDVLCQLTPDAQGVLLREGTSGRSSLPPPRLFRDYGHTSDVFSYTAPTPAVVAYDVGPSPPLPHSTWLNSLRHASTHSTPPIETPYYERPYRNSLNSL